MNGFFIKILFKPDNSEIKSIFLSDINLEERYDFILAQ
jgi:hypothetical protein